MVSSDVPSTMTASDNISLKEIRYVCETTLYGKTVYRSPLTQKCSGMYFKNFSYPISVFSAGLQGFCQKIFHREYIIAGLAGFAHLRLKPPV